MPEPKLNTDWNFINCSRATDLFQYPFTSIVKLEAPDDSISNVYVPLGTNSFINVISVVPDLSLNSLYNSPFLYISTVKVTLADEVTSRCIFLVRLREFVSALGEGITNELLRKRIVIVDLPPCMSVSWKLVNCCFCVLSANIDPALLCSHIYKL